MKDDEPTDEELEQLVNCMTALVFLLAVAAVAGLGAFVIKLVEVIG